MKNKSQESMQQDSAKQEWIKPAVISLDIENTSGGKGSIPVPESSAPGSGSVGAS